MTLSVEIAAHPVRGKGQDDGGQTAALGNSCYTGKLRCRSCNKQAGIAEPTRASISRVASQRNEIVDFRVRVVLLTVYSCCVSIISLESLWIAMPSVTNEFAVLALMTGTERCHVIDDEHLLIYVAITTRGRRRIKEGCIL